MAEASRIRLFDVEPDLIQFLTEEDRAEARDLALPSVSVSRGTVPLSDLLRRHNAFGALVLDGMLLQSVQVGDQLGQRLLGPGDVAGLADDFSSTVRVACTTRTEGNVSLILLGNEMLVAVHRWPRLLTGLLARVSQQAERLADQLVICQLPRVEDRILGIMWQLAESWGYVTRLGTVVPLTLTHELLGGLIGARRSTVTLAIGRLAERGALVRSSEAWLLLERPLRPEERQVPVIAPTPLLSAVAKPVPQLVIEDWQTIRDTVARLRDEHERTRMEVRDRLQRLREARAARADGRSELTRGALRRRSAP